MEEHIIAPSNPLFYKRYADDTYVRRKKNETDALFNALKLPVHWTSKIPVRYKRNAIIGELQRAKKSTSNFDFEIKCIVNKYTAAGFPCRFVRSITDNFDSGKDNLSIPQWLFEEKKAFAIHLPFSSSNENFVKAFISKLSYFTNAKCKFNVVWKKEQPLFPLKDKVDRYSCNVYRGDCSCDQLH